MSDFKNMLAGASEVTKGIKKPTLTKEQVNRKLFNIPMSEHERKLCKALKLHYNFNSEAETIRYLLKDGARSAGIMV